MVIFTKKFRTLNPHLPIVWDKVLKKTVFLTPSLSDINGKGKSKVPFYIYFSAPVGTQKTEHIFEEYQFSVRHYVCTAALHRWTCFVSGAGVAARKLELLVLGLVAPVSGDSTRLRRSLVLSMWSLTLHH